MQKSQMAPTVLRDPKEGGVVVAPAGGKAEIHFRCANPGNPNVAYFSLRIEGLPDSSWAESPERGVAPDNEETLILILKPPYDAAEGDYDFRVQRLMDGSADGTAIVLTLEVAGFLTPSETDSGHAVVEPMTIAPSQEEERRRQEQTRLDEERRRQEQARQDEAQRNQGDDRTRQDQEQKRQNEENVRRERERVQAELERRKQEQVRQAEEQRKQQEAEKLRLEDLTPREQPEASKAQETDDETPPLNTIADPQDGTVLAVRPGETVLVRFSILNDATTTATYIIDHDHTPLVEEWIELSPDQINLPRSGKGTLGLRLTPPLNARPGEYSFAVSFGRIGAAQTMLGLVLSVLPTPAVKLTTAMPLVKVGPFPRAVDFDIKVTGDGNADTAFRIGVKEPPVASGAAAKQGPDILYESPEWRYLFNKEVDNVGVEERSPNPRQTAIQLRVLRKGIWWFGFKETHKLRVAAVPVTEPTNCGKLGNVIELTALRWRLLPFSSVMLLPILFLLYLLLSGGASDLEIKDAAFQDNNNVYYIVDSNVKKQIKLSWEASPWDFLRLRGSVDGTPSISKSMQLGSGEHTDTVSVGDKNFVQYDYDIQRFWGGSASRDVKVKLVRTDPTRKLKLTAQVGAKITSLIPDENGRVELMVPSKGVVHLNLVNVSSPADQAVQYALVQDLSGDAPFMFDFVLQAIGSVPPYGSTPISLKVNPNAASGRAGTNDTTFILVTTSAKLPLLRVKLVPGP